MYSRKQSKIEQLQDYYKQIGQQERYERTMNIVDENAALQEINNALKNRNENGEINNKESLKWWRVFHRIDLSVF